MVSAVTLSLLAAIVSIPGASPIVAEVNGQVITRRDVDVSIMPVLKQLERRYKGEELEKKKEEYYDQALKELVDHRLLVQEAKDLDVTVDEKVVDERLEGLAERVGGWPRLLDMFRRAGISLDDKIKQVREGEIVKKLLAFVVVPRLYTSPSDVRRYYDEHTEEFEEPAQYRVSQIILGKKDDAAAVENRKKMEEMKALLKAGEDFGDLARKHSIGPHKDEGGDWGLLKETDLIEGLREALPGMKTGEVKGPVDTKKYLHLIKVTNIKKSAVRSFNDVQETIKMMLRKQAYLVETQKYVDELRRKAHVKILDVR